MYNNYWSGIIVIWNTLELSGGFLISYHSFSSQYCQYCKPLSLDRQLLFSPVEVLSLLQLIPVLFQRSHYCLEIPWKTVMMMWQKLLDLKMLPFQGRMSKKSLEFWTKVTETGIHGQTLTCQETGPLRLKEIHPLLLKTQFMMTLKRRDTDQDRWAVLNTFGSTPLFIKC